MGNLEKALILNIDDYHNIHVQRQSDTTNTSWAVHMATIIVNPCSAPAIPRNGVLNPKIANLGIRYYDRIKVPRNSYYDRMQNHARERSDDELIDELTLHCYDDRITKKEEIDIYGTLFFFSLTLRSIA